MPGIKSLFKHPSVWQDGTDCLFIDSDEATKEQIAFVSRVKRLYMPEDPEASNSHAVQETSIPGDVRDDDHSDLYEFRVNESCSPWETEIEIPKKFVHVDLARLAGTENRIEELMAVVEKVHPWSSLHYGLSALDAVKKLYLEWMGVIKHLGKIL